ncbi:DNA polymerase III subunit beta [Caldalkalibacillus thermarum]|uniref:DNA polymerase III subunit beta n=1 Tax=Caldalkalibacillus thermarum TaxID=296745 RepID=UPI00166B1471|nr:DNA polymerase III subunit beta [Caldalkalibacillus thermarum]GGK22524.1 DNA polymerase III subunit beta [Caldalkalibacillus thermarum]
MRFEADPKFFSETVSLVAKNTSSHSTIPVFTGIKLEAGTDGLTVTGGDENLTVQVSALNGEINIKETGRIIVPAKHFAGILKKLPPEPVKVTTQGQSVKLRSGSAEISLNGMDAEEYPRLPTKKSGGWTIPAKKIKKLIRHTAFAASRSESRPILTGCLIKMGEGELKIIATDSYRLAQCSVEVETEDGTEFQAVVPGKALVEIRQMLCDDESVSLYMAGSHMVWETGNKTFFTRLLDGTYPNTDRVIPTKFKTKIQTDSNVLRSALDRMSVLATTHENNVVIMKITTEEVELLTPKFDVGQAGEKVKVIKMEGEEITIRFNAKFVMDALRAIDSSMVEISLSGEVSPFVIKPVDQKEHIHLILPIRVRVY